MKKDFVIRILFIEPLVEEAEKTINMLRNAGIAVRPTRAVDDAGIRAALAELEPDLVMFDPDHGTPPLPDVMHLLDAHGSDYALLGLVDSLDNPHVAEMFEQGAQGIAARNMPGQLLAVLRREFDALLTRRQLRRLEVAKRELERRCEALLASSRDAIAYVHEGVHVRANQTYLETFGHENFDDLLGMPILDMIDAADVDEFKRLLRGHSRQEKLPSQVNLRARRADGSVFDATAEFAPATFEGEPCLQIVFRRQATTDPAAQEQLQHDPVTGLYNRTSLLDRVDDAVSAAATGCKGQSLLLITPDNWAAISASVGLGKSDELLAGFAGHVRRLLADEDVAGVIGEHTIGVLLAPRSDAAIHAWTGELLQAVSRGIFDAGNRSITLTASIGGSLLGERNANVDELLEQASNSLRSAIGKGGNTTQLHDPAAREKADEQSELAKLESLKQALANDGMLLYHQQIVSLQDIEGDFSEILLRMDGSLGELKPAAFMPIADKHGLSGAIDRFVLTHAIEVLRQRESSGANTTFFVKIAVGSAEDASLLPWLAEQLQRAALQHGRLVLEMSESKVTTLLRPVCKFVESWKRLGGQFALEQFGSSLNAFQLLDHIDADYLKIDRVYMAGLAEHPENQRKIAELCQQARKLGKQTIAEWVEDATSTSLLFAAGVDFVQGNFLQVPQRLE